MMTALTDIITGHPARYWTWQVTTITTSVDHLVPSCVTMTDAASAKCDHGSSCVSGSAECRVKDGVDNKDICVEGKVYAKKTNKCESEVIKKALEKKIVKKEIEIKKLMSTYLKNFGKSKKEKKKKKKSRRV